MARATFGGGIADFVIQAVGGGITKLAPATLSFYSAKTGGTQYTDLLVGGSAAASVSVGSDGQVPQFQGPDGVFVMWADGGGSRVQMVAVADAVALATAPTDTTVAAAINTPGGATATALSASYAPWNKQRELAALDARAQADRLDAGGNSRIAFDTAEHIREDWADLTGWFTEGVATSTNTLITAAGTKHSARLPLDLSGPFRLQARLTYTTGGSGLAFLGVCTDATAAAPGNGAIVGMGINATTTKLMRWHGASTEPTWTVGNGDYLVTVVGDETNISLTVTSAAGFLEQQYNVARSSLAPLTGIGIWQSSTTVVIKDITFTRGQIASPQSRVVADLGPSVHWTPVGGEGAHIALPKGYDSRKPVPIILWCHGAGGTELTPLTEWAALYRDVIGAGYALVSSNLHGRNWGNAAAQADLVTLYRYLRQRYPLGPVVLWGNSMGGATSLNALARREIPAVAWMGTQPVCDLQKMYVKGQFITEMRAAYGVAADGSDWVAKTAGWNPMDRAGWEFRGVPMRMWASPADTVVPRVDNADALLAKVAPYATEATIVTTSGDHGDPSHYAPQTADIIAFLDRVTRV